MSVVCGIYLDVGTDADMVTYQPLLSMQGPPKEHSSAKLTVMTGYRAVSQIVKVCIPILYGDGLISPIRIT